MGKKQKNISWLFLFDYKSFLILGLFALIIVLATNVIYRYTQNLLKDRLQEKLVAIVSTAALQFEAVDISQINGKKDMDEPVFKRIVNQLRRIREANENIKFVYVMRRGAIPTEFEFVADADSLASFEEIDENKNGLLDENEKPPQSGDAYDITEYPVLRDEAFHRPSVDRELQPDQWGLIMAAYAPIWDEEDNAVAIIGIDVLVDDYLDQIRATLLPFLFFILALIFLLTLLTLLLIRVWHQRVEAVNELDRQKDELLSIVSHQLATPVSSVRWYLEMLNDGDLGKLTQEQREHIQSMHGITVNLADLVGMILDVSRIQLGKVKIEKQELDLNVFLKEILEIIEPRAKEKGVHFNVKMPSSLSKAMLDKRYTHMTIENLLSNAVKYTPKNGRVDFLVEFRGNTLYCEVKDTGCGIPKADQDKIFGKLFRASNVRNAMDGNGFGLYVAKGAIEAQGGRIWFESEENRGTTFFVELPLGIKRDIS